MKALRLAAVTLALAAAVAAAARYGWLLLLEAPDIAPGAAAPVELTIEDGEGVASVAARMEESGLVVSARRFRLLARLVGADRAMHAGTYQFAPGSGPREILRDMVEGNVRLERITLPEGWRLAQIAEEVECVLGVPADSIRAAAADSSLRAALACPAETLEGYLFPETYHFPDGVSALQIVTAMAHRFEDVWSTLPPVPHKGLSRHDVVTLASIVEAETYIDSEKPRIAAVYLNRLERGWKLQADPTVRFGIEQFTGRLYYRHLDVDTPYNTYLYKGLPPSPIGAPGRSSLLAVLQPLEPCEDLYFVASGNGGHVFSRTGEEHIQAKLAARVQAEAEAKALAEAAPLAEAEPAAEAMPQPAAAVTR
jgi:UPF0755 protein